MESWAKVTVSDESVAGTNMEQAAVTSVDKQLSPLAGRIVTSADMTVSGKYSAAKHQNPYADEPRMLDSALIASCCVRNSAISGATTDQAHPE